MPKKTTNVLETKFTVNDRFSKNIGRMSRGLAFMNRVADRTKRAMRATGRAMLMAGRAGARVARVGFYAIAGAATAVFLSVSRLADGMDSLAKTTRAINFPIEEFQEYSFAAQQSGVESESFTKSLKKFTKTVGEVKGGYGAMYTALKKTNPQLLRQIKNTDNVAEAFDMYLTAIRETPNAMNKAALATAGFGRDGLSMVNMANLSSDALAGLRSEMRENGVVTQAQAAKAEVFNDMLNRMKLTIKGVAVDGLTPLMPLLTEAMNATRKWIVENRGLIKQKVESTFKNIVKYGKIAFKFLKTNIPPLIKTIKEIGSKGFAWIKDNKKELIETGDTIKTMGRILLSVASFAMKHKFAILAAAMAWKGLSVSLSLISFAGVSSGAAGAALEVGGLMGRTKMFAGMIGKGGLVVTAALAGAAIGTAIFQQWFSTLDALEQKAGNVAAAMGLGTSKMTNVELDASQNKMATQQKKLEIGKGEAIASVFNPIVAMRTAYKYITNKDALKSTKQAQIDILQEKKRRLMPNVSSGGKSGSEMDSPSLNPVDRVPQVQVQRMESMKTEKTEIVIRDETGRAEVTKGRSSKGLTLLKTGAP